MMNIIKIGWIGLGRMGNPMCEQLIKAGYRVTVYNRSKKKEEALKALGASVAETPAMLIGQTEIVFIMVSDDAAINDIFNGDDGLLSAQTSGKIIINMSTVSPAISRQISAACQQQGNHYLDAPVSGSVKQAIEAQLVIMVGGNEAAFEQARPVLEKLGKLAMLVGSNGAGNTAKLAINALLSFHAMGLAEAITLAEQNGIKTEDLMMLINSSALGNAFMKIKGDAIISGNYQPAFALKHIAKDLRLAKDIGLNTPLGNTVYQTFTGAEPTLGEEDIIAVIKQIKR